MEDNDVHLSDIVREAALLTREWGRETKDSEIVLTQKQIETALRASFNRILYYLTLERRKVYLAGFLNFDTARYSGARRPNPQNPKQLLDNDPHYRITLKPSAHVKALLKDMVKI
jgi:hypothetical protein